MRGGGGCKVAEGAGVLLRQSLQSPDKSISCNIQYVHGTALTCSWIFKKLPSLDV
jgi:hypothetical protein